GTNVVQPDDGGATPRHQRIESVSRALPPQDDDAGGSVTGAGPQCRCQIDHVAVACLHGGQVDEPGRADARHRVTVGRGSRVVDARRPASENLGYPDSFTLPLVAIQDHSFASSAYPESRIIFW
ncbi:hypothetical protein AVEN_23235-1, partial [Araneus ventricosus]